MNDNSSNDAYTLAVRTAVVAAVFSLVVCAVMLYAYTQRSAAADPAEERAVQIIKARILENPDDETLKEEFRAFDQKLRQEYFRQAAFAGVGAWLLLAGVGVFLVSARFAVSIKRKLPHPEQKDGKTDVDESTARVAYWSVAGLIVVLAVGAIGLGQALRSQLRKPDEQVAVVAPPEDGPDDPVDEPGPQPTDEPKSGWVLPPGPALPLPDTPADAEELAKSWPRFRGLDGQGVSPYTNIPVKWDGKTGENVIWKAPVPLKGKNSPVVCRGRVFVTGANQEKRELYCFDAATGQLLWQCNLPEAPKDPDAPKPKDDKPFEAYEHTGYAAPTVVTDGFFVFAIFANGDIHAVDYEGNIAWSRGFGIPDNHYSHASSLLMFENLVLVQFDQGARKDKLSKFMALDAETGKTFWEVPRDVGSSWTTPIIIEAAGRTQLITAAEPWVISYNPSDGSEIWRADCLKTGEIGPSPGYRNDTVYVANEYPDSFAIAADGSGDVSTTHVKWEGSDGLPQSCCPLITDKFVFLLPTHAVLTACDIKTGEWVWEEEFEAKQCTSSPSLVGDLIYLFFDDGTSAVVRPGDKGCERVGEGSLGEKCVTSPAFANGQMFIRGEKHLFCIGTTDEATDVEQP